jgi:hypothetical protein
MMSQKELDQLKEEKLQKNPDLNIVKSIVKLTQENKISWKPLPDSSGIPCVFQSSYNKFNFKLEKINLLK